MDAIEHSFCLKTSEELGVLSTSANFDIVHVSCLFLRNTVQRMSAFWVDPHCWGIAMVTYEGVLRREQSWLDLDFD